MKTKHFTIDFINQWIPSSLKKLRRTSYPLGSGFILETVKPVYWFIFHYYCTNFFFLIFSTGYTAFSVSESKLDKVIKYILNQEEDHKNKSFTAEYDEFLRACNVTGV
ncbi:MAG: hypothetical protein BMS9Abin39_0384 [Ignavibacteria bacterium]|nr:MAG: hypothetical protein BMS9Abin39_0384 [Ignavibacteria bacterium]